MTQQPAGYLCRGGVPDGRRAAYTTGVFALGGETITMLAVGTPAPRVVTGDAPSAAACPGWWFARGNRRSAEAAHEKRTKTRCA